MAYTRIPTAARPAINFKVVRNTASRWDPLDLSGRKGRNAARKQERAQRENLRQQTEIYEGNRSDIAANTARGEQVIGEYGDRGISSLSDAYGQQTGYYGQAGGALGSGYSDAQQGLSSGYGQARSDLGSVDTSSPLGAGFDQDPGYQFRLAQGQQALDRSQAASGGRYSGAALKAGVGYNSGMASQEFGAAAARDAQLRGMRLGQAGGMANLASGYGQQMAGLSSDYGQSMAGLYGNQADAAGQLGGQQAGMYSTMGGQLAGLYSSASGQNQANAGLLSGAYNNYAQVPGAADQANVNAGKQTGIGVLTAL